MRMLALIPLMDPLVIIKLDWGNANGSSVSVHSTFPLLILSKVSGLIDSRVLVEFEGSRVSGGSLGMTGTKFSPGFLLSSLGLLGIWMPCGLFRDI